MQTIGERIRAFRDSRGLTQKEIFLATKEEIKQTTLSAIENGQAKPGFETIAALLNAYQELSADWLIRGSGPMIIGEPAPPQRQEPAPAPTGPAYTPAAPAATDPLVRQLIDQLAEEKRQHREEMRELKRDHREDLRAAATNHENILADMRRQIDRALDTVRGVQEENMVLKRRLGLVAPTAAEEEAQRQQQSNNPTGRLGFDYGKKEVPEAEEAEAEMTSWSNPAFTRPQKATEASPLKIAA